MSDENVFVHPSEKFIQAANKLMKNKGFTPLDPGGGERFGVWECTWLKCQAKRKEWVTLSACPTEGNSNQVTLEVLAGADEGLHYWKEPVYHESLQRNRFENSEANFTGELEKAFASAVDLAGKFGSKELNNKYKGKPHEIQRDSDTVSYRLTSESPEDQR